MLGTKVDSTKATSSLFTISNKGSPILRLVFVSVCLCLRVVGLLSLNVKTDRVDFCDVPHSIVIFY